MLKTSLKSIISNGGFLSKDDVYFMAAADRMRKLLVRCGVSGCRYICAAQDVQHLTDIIRSDGRDSVRDVQLLAEDPAYKGQYHQHTYDRERGDNRNPPTLTPPEPGPTILADRGESCPPCRTLRMRNYACDHGQEYGDADPGV